MSENNFSEELGQLPPDLTLGATSEQIMRRGRRIRTLRQTSIVGAAAVAVLGITSVAALAGGHHGAQIVQSGSGNGIGIALAPASSSPAPSIPLASITASADAPSSAPASPASTPSPWPTASTSPSVSCSPAAQSTIGAPAATPDGNAPPWGTLVQAGTDVGTTTNLVLYGIHIDDAAIPCTHFGLMVGTVDASGNTTGVYESNEFAGSDLTPGFHAVSMVGKEFAGNVLRRLLRRTCGHDLRRRRRRPDCRSRRGVERELRRQVLVARRQRERQPDVWRSHGEGRQRQRTAGRYPRPTRRRLTAKIFVPGRALYTKSPGRAARPGSEECGTEQQLTSGRARVRECLGRKSPVADRARRRRAAPNRQPLRSPGLARRCALPVSPSRHRAGPRSNAEPTVRSGRPQG